MPSKKAVDIKVGDSVLHSGQFWKIREVQVIDGSVNCTTTQGGIVSFMVNSVIKFY